MTELYSSHSNARLVHVNIVRQDIVFYEYMCDILHIIMDF